MCLYVSLADRSTSDNLIDAPPEPSLLTHQSSLTINSENDLKRYREMLEKEKMKLNLKIEMLEKRIEDLESNSPKKYPPVKRLSFHDQKRILITGGAGFVGSHLVDRLMTAGHQVIVADNFVTGRKRNIEHWVNHENFELMHHDIVNPLMGEL